MPLISVVKIICDVICKRWSKRGANHVIIKFHYGRHSQHISEIMLGTLFHGKLP